MMGYSDELNRIVEKICEYYEENDNLQFLRKIIYFEIEAIEYVDENYFIVSKDIVNKYINGAKIIWDLDGDAKKLRSLYLLYEKELGGIKDFGKILENNEECAAMYCVLHILSNDHDDPTNQFVYEFLELFVGRLKTLNVEENKIRILLEKYFKEII
jgi:hypothetical protein